MGNILSFIFFNYLSYVKQLNYSNNISVWLIGKNRLLTLKQKQQHYEILHVASSWSWRFQLLCRLPQVPCWYHLLTLHRASNNLTRLGSDDIPRTGGRHQTRRRLMMKFLYFVYNAHPPRQRALSLPRTWSIIIHCVAPICSCHVVLGRRYNTHFFRFCWSSTLLSRLRTGLASLSYG